MSGWRNETLGSGSTQILDGDRGKNYPSKQQLSPAGHCLFLSAANVTKRGFEFSSCEFISVEKDELLRKGKLQRNDSVLTTRGTVGNVAYFGPAVPFDNIRINSGMVIIRPDPNQISPEFLSLFLRSQVFSDQISSLASGSAQPQLPIRDLKRVEVPIPPLPEQREIAAVLGALDDKIELNRKTAATLEAMARALYRSWFVDFDPVQAKSEGRAPAHMDEATAALFPDSFGEDGLPEGWEPGTLADLAELNPEKHSKKTHPSVIEYVDLSNTKWGTIEATTSFGWEDAPSRARMVLRAGDTIVGTVRPGNGSFSFVSREGLTGSTGFAVLRPKSACNDALIYCAATDGETIGSLANLADGGAYPAVRPEVVGTREIVIAPDAILQAFAILAQPLIMRIEAFKRENQTLAALRDTLLPRLMSGELNIGAVRDQVDAVQ